MKKILKKLSATSGESLAETLIAVLIIAVALTMLASMISSTSSLVKKGEEQLNRYYTESEKLETFSELGPESKPKVKFTAESTTYTIKISDVSVDYAENTIFAGHPVIAYHMQ